MRGVPRERDAISKAPSSSISMRRMSADLVTISFKLSGVYSSSCSLMPKRSRSGEESMPRRVVAPISVNRGRSSRMLRAPGPLPMMISSAKSSIAGYRTSSTFGFRRWISSIKSTSPGLRFVNSAARSPACVMAGPLVTRRDTPISFAMMPASVVLPRPGGP